MAARWDTKQTTLAPRSDETRARDPLVCYAKYLDKPTDKLPKIEKHGPTIGPRFTKAG